MNGKPELWAGVECTVNRVGDRYFDQLVRNGHHVRLDDLDRLAQLGITALRFPVLWERTAPNGLASADWSWADRRLERLRELGIRPIIGLVHHGSGPPHTSLVDSQFPEGLATFARAVAERYPWVTDYTPVNEPLTTARFSCLYGLWYPHARSVRAFYRAVVIQCQATVDAMAGIREVVPTARLIQTEDAGATASTPALAYQADYENHRRWLSLDLLAGTVGPQHPLHAHLLDAGIPDAQLNGLQEAACTPDVVGMNYYVVSDRFLDERLDEYPAKLHGGNGRDSYADAEAVRCGIPGAFRGHAGALREAWQRYHRPVALTEIHIDGAREQQLRWAAEAWNAAVTVQAEGIDVRAVTLWAALGSYDWNLLLTQENGYYETGIYDVRGGTPRATILTRFATSVSRGEPFAHPVLHSPGWWRRSDRFHKGWRSRAREAEPDHTGSPASIVISGASGTLGAAFGRIASERDLHPRLASRREMDIADPASVAAFLDRERPWAVINAAGFVDVDSAERESERCHRENILGAETLARACRERGIKFVTFSSDLVFDGTEGRPYVESDRPEPLSVYGRSKAQAETAVRDADPHSLVIRTSAFFGPWDEYNVLTRALRTLREGKRVNAAEDLVVSPTYVPDLVHVTLNLLVDDEEGIWHLANAGAVTWADLLLQGARSAGLDPNLVQPCPARALGWHAPRPRFSALGSERAPLMPSLEDSLARYLQEASIPLLAAQAVEIDVSSREDRDDL